MSEWKLIESAPRDGTSILLYVKGRGATEARFAEGEWSDDTPITPREYNGACWVCCDDAWNIEVEEYADEDDKNITYYNDGAATHWMPLPPPPQEP